jgi:hypothetical protein
MELSLMMILLVADFVDAPIKGRDDLRLLGPPCCYARAGGPQRGRFEGRNDDFTWLLPSMAFMQIAVIVRSFSDRNLTLSPRRP